MKEVSRNLCKCFLILTAYLIFHFLWLMLTEVDYGDGDDDDDKNKNNEAQPSQDFFFLASIKTMAKVEEGRKWASQELGRKVQINRKCHQEQEISPGKFTFNTNYLVFCCWMKVVCLDWHIVTIYLCTYLQKVKGSSERKSLIRFLASFIVHFMLYMLVCDLWR